MCESSSHFVDYSIHCLCLPNILLWRRRRRNLFFFCFCLFFSLAVDKEVLISSAAMKGQNKSFNLLDSDENVSGLHRTRAKNFCFNFCCDDWWQREMKEKLTLYNRTDATTIYVSRLLQLINSVFFNLNFVLIELFVSVAACAIWNHRTLSRLHNMHTHFKREIQISLSKSNFRTFHASMRPYERNLFQSFSYANFVCANAVRHRRQSDSDRLRHICKNTILWSIGCLTAGPRHERKRLNIIYYQNKKN